MTWKEYEEEVFQYFAGRFPNARIRKNVKLKGHHSEVDREIDILIEEQILGHIIQIAVECKNWQSKLDVEDVGKYIDKLNDVRISKGVIISKVGFSETCYTRAKKEIGLQLQVIDFENMPEFHHFYGVPYRGPLGAVISAPNGWVVDSKVPSDAVNHLLCFIHPFEFSLEESGKRNQLMYCQILPLIPPICLIDEENPDNSGWQDGITLEDIINNQNQEVRKNDPGSKIEEWEETKGETTIKYREIEYSVVDQIELTAGLEIGNIVAYFVCTLPKDYRPDDVARLKHVVETAVFVEMPDVDPENSHQAWKKFAHGEDD
jgi:hypothetical protein